MKTIIPKYPNYYISESGIVTNSNGIVQRYSLDNNERLFVTIEGNKEYIDELVAMTFLQNPNNFYYIEHTDHDGLNNHVSNLRYTNIKPKVDPIPNRNRKYSRSSYKYEVYNEDAGDSIICYGRGEVAELIQYEEISLKNMVGNGRKIFVGPYKGYQIRRLNGPDNQFSHVNNK